MHLSILVVDRDFKYHGLSVWNNIPVSVSWICQFSDYEKPGYSHWDISTMFGKHCHVIALSWFLCMCWLARRKIILCLVMTDKISMFFSTAYLTLHKSTLRISTSIAEIVKARESKVSTWIACLFWEDCCCPYVLHGSVWPQESGSMPALCQICSRCILGSTRAALWHRFSSLLCTEFLSAAFEAAGSCLRCLLMM